MRAQELIDTLGLQPHPEGGWFKEVFRSPLQVAPLTGGASRSAITTIYYLLAHGQHSRWHRVMSDEVWIHLEGAPLALFTSDAALRTAPAHVKLGPVDAHGTRPQHTVAAGLWQAARMLAGPDGADFSLVSCSVGPGFDFEDFSFMAPDGEEAALVRHHWPELADLI